jgi:hypothetical protein
VKLSARDTEAYVLDQRNSRIDSFDTWHSRIREADALIRGEYPGVSIGGKPAVMNLADQMPRDVARLAGEVDPSYSAAQVGDGLDHARNATLRAIIGEGYFKFGRWDLIRPQLVMDLVISGTAFLAFWPDETRSQYPLMMRVDPRNCYPDTFNGEIQDLLVVSQMKIRVANRMFPKLRIMERLKEREDTADSVEVLDYYSKDIVVKAVGVVSLGGEAIEADIVSSYKPKTDIAPVAFGQLPSPDGAFRGLIDQVGGSLVAKDKAVKDLLEYGHQMVYSPFEAKGILNADTLPAIDTIYQHDPSATTETFMRRVQPAGANPQVFGLIQYLDTEQRNALNYPATRSGDVSVSQGSAAYVNSTMGGLTSLVRESQRILVDMQQRGAAVMFQLDQHHLDVTKPLMRHLKKKKMYTPSVDIDGKHELTVTYGAGAGLDKTNNMVQNLQLYSAGVMPGKRMLAEIGISGDPETWLDERQDEELERIVLQRFSGDPQTSLDFLMAVLQLKREKGLDFVEAYTQVQQKQSSQMAPPEGAQAGMMGGEPGAAEPAAQQEALAAGETGPQGAPPIAGEFSKTPMQQVFVK